jgi:hypothetical protein
MEYVDTVKRVASLYADRLMNADHVHDVIVTMNESFDKPVDEIRRDIMSLARTLETESNEFGCDWCGKHIENGSGYYLDDDRICGQCMLVYNPSEKTY